MDPQETGLIVSAFGRNYHVELANHQLLPSVTRGKKVYLTCGDHVNVTRLSPTQGIIESLRDRQNLFLRSNAFRQKLIAANITQLIIILASRPSFYDDLLNRWLVAAETIHIKPVIVLNKNDLPETATVLERLGYYQTLGYSVLSLCAKHNVEPVRPVLTGHRSLLIGQSGMGKSTLINQLVPGSNIRTQAFSEALDSGKHSTTASRLYHLDVQTAIIDTPGLQEFGLRHLSHDEIAYGFVEFRPYLGQCYFKNCRHWNEPQCAILAANQQQHIHPDRLQSYHKLLRENNMSKPHP